MPNCEGSWGFKGKWNLFVMDGLFNGTDRTNKTYESHWSYGVRCHAPKAWGFKVVGVVLLGKY